MRTLTFALGLILWIVLPPVVRADDDAAKVKKAVERSMLNQLGTEPFHLKATFAPRKVDSQPGNRSGEIEIWWASPTQYRREVRTPEFQQIDVVNSGLEWQKTNGDYFPEWLRERSAALIEPVPNLDDVLKQVDNADVKRLFGSTHYSWMIPSSNGEIQGTVGAGISISDSTGLIQYGSGRGWSGEFSDFHGFHGRKVAFTIASGSPEVVAKVTALDDLGSVSPDLFDVNKSGGDSPLLRTLLVDEMELRKNMLPGDPPSWPALPDGPLEGALTTTIVVDRAGNVRDVESIVSNNPGVNDTARTAIAAMRFQPYIEDGVPVQVVSRITMSFKSARPAGIESFDSARNYFERGRQASFPAAAVHASPYVLRATFQARIAAGQVADGQYTDTWERDDEWRREATIGTSRCIRARHGDKYYRLAEGADAALLQLAMKALEPIPAIDTFVESDWKIKRDPIDGKYAIRVLTGYVAPDGDFDAEHVRAYWFDDSGTLQKTYFGGLETRRSNFQNYEGTAIAHQIDIYHAGGLGLAIRVTEISTAEPLADSEFEIHGHEWTRAFTDEVR